MTRYALNLPAKLKQEAEEFASRQRVSLNQFIYKSYHSIHDPN
jgi:predicted HicB family RNase H-like nuclease